MDQNLIDHFEDLLESDQNDPAIQYQIGLCYQNGEGVEQNGVQAERWFRRAAEQGHREAQALLSAAQEQKETLERITEDSLSDWCLRAEERDADAQYQVACYFLEHPEQGSREEAKRYLNLASEQGNGNACTRLAQIFLEEGRAAEAVAMLIRGKEKNVPEALELLARCYATGTGTSRDPQRAEELLTQWADQGDGEAKLKLAGSTSMGSMCPKTW